MTEFDIGKFKDVKLIHVSAIRTLDDREDQLNILDKLILHCTEEHALLKRAKFTRPPPPWMKDLPITALLRGKYQPGHEAHSHKSWNSSGQIRNKIERKLNEIKNCHIKKVFDWKNSKKF